LLTGQIDVENPDKNYRFSNIDQLRHVKTIFRRCRDVTIDKWIDDDNKFKIVMFVL